MLPAAVVLLAIPVVLGLVIGGRYLTATQMMSYQGEVLRRPWHELEPRLQAVMLAMLRVVGGGFVALALAIAALCWPLYRGERWAPWAILIVAAAMLVPALYSTLALRRVEPRAKTPVLPTAIAMVLIAAGAIVALLA